MRDSDFKHLSHQVGQFRIATLGTEVTKGYKPDVTVTDSSGRVVFILESENKTDRKAFLGDLVKAEKFSQERGNSLFLIIVMSEMDNTTVDQIADHLKPYFEWLKDMGASRLGLRGCFVLSDEQYCRSVANAEILGSDPFLARCKLIMGDPVV